MMHVLEQSTPGFRTWLVGRMGLVVSWGKVVVEGKWRSDKVEERGESLSGVFFYCRQLGWLRAY